MQPRAHAREAAQFKFKTRQSPRTLAYVDVPAALRHRVQQVSGIDRFSQHPGDVRGQSCYSGEPPCTRSTHGGVRGQ